MIDDNKEAEAIVPVTWSSLSASRQLQLREEYGVYLDQLPPTCSMDQKVNRFREWLSQRGIDFDFAG